MFLHLLGSKTLFSLQSCSKQEMRRGLEWAKFSKTFSLSFLSLNKLFNTFSLLLKRYSAGIMQVVVMDSYRMRDWPCYGQK